MATFVRPGEAGARTGAIRLAGPAATIFFTGYTADCRVAGSLEHGWGRLDSRLGRPGELVIANATVRSLSGKPAVQVPQIVLPTGGWLAVELPGRAGLPGPIGASFSTALVVNTGPYQIRGFVQALPGADPVAAFREGSGMARMRDACLTYPAGTETRFRLVRDLAVNRHLVDRVILAADHDAAERAADPASWYWDLTGR